MSGQLEISVRWTPHSTFLTAVAACAGVFRQISAVRSSEVFKQRGLLRYKLFAHAARLIPLVKGFFHL